MIEALKKSLGVVEIACKSVGINRWTHYSWLKKDSKYAEQVNDIENIALDFAESKLHNLIKDGDTTAVIFFLKTKGKKRGYNEAMQFGDGQLVSQEVITIQVKK